MDVKVMTAEDILNATKKTINAKLQEDDNVMQIQTTLFPPMLKDTTLSQLQPCYDTDKHAQCVRAFWHLPNKEPSKLSALTPQHAARWPIECEVLDTRVNHIDYVPSSPEVYYESTETEAQPLPMGTDVGSVVFEYQPVTPMCYFTRSTAGGSKAQTKTLNVDALTFESRFESGNLARAIMITANFYELHVRADLYTNKHQQWYYFKVMNMKKNVRYRFSIVNLAKSNSLYNEGMKPLMYSTKDARIHRVGWRRRGLDIVYYSNATANETDADENGTYTLTFTIEFPHDNDEVYLAHSYPYTYTQLQDYLNQITLHPIKSTFTTLRLLCRTLAGNNVYYLTITSPNETLAADQTPPIKEPKKKAVILTARVHPGETPSSYMMKGMIDFLTGDTSQAKELRNKFIFKIIPMLNPDGVIVGNSRCSLTGRDLNRQYRTVIRETYPSVWHTKLMTRRLLEECGVAIYCDLHAHSRKHNIFLYGCESRRDKALHEQIFPLMLHKNTADKFSFEDCKFRIQRNKEGTGRVVFWLLGVQNSYTLEASFGGSRIGNRTQTHFSTYDYEMMGRSFCETLLDFSDEHPHKERLRTKILERLSKNGSNADVPTNICLSDYTSDDADTFSTNSDEALFERTLSVDYVEVQVPPSSPITPRLKRKGAKSKKEKMIALQRQMLPVTRQTLDWPTTEPDVYDDEPIVSDNLDKVNKQVKAVYFINENIENMPVKRNPRRSLSVVDIQPIKVNHEMKNRLQSLPPQRARNAQATDLQVKLRTLRQQILTNLGLKVNEPLTWNMSVLAATAYQNDCDNLLRACSQKLHAQQKKERVKTQKTKTLKSAVNKNVLPQLGVVNDCVEREVKSKKVSAKSVKTQSKSQQKADNNVANKSNSATSKMMKKDKSTVTKMILNLIHKEDKSTNSNTSKSNKLAKLKKKKKTKKDDKALVD